MSEAPVISLVIPAYNEEGNLEEVYRRLTAVMTSMPHNYEAIIIDNCSGDGTQRIAEEICARDPRWRYIRFSKNFGAEMSLTVGIRHARGEAIINVFSDLQDPPELIPQMIAKWREGLDVVYGVIQKRSDHSWAKQRAARVAYWLIYRLSDCKIPPNASDFRLITRPVAEALNAMTEQDRYVRGLIHWVGFRQTGIPYERAERTWGETKAGFWWCVRFALNAVLSFSAAPLRMASYFGLIACGVSLILMVVYLFIWMVWRTAPHGWTTITLIILFQGGLQSLFVGIIGEYLARIYKESKRRPLWIIQKSINVDEPITIGLSSAPMPLPKLSEGH